MYIRHILEAGNGSADRWLSDTSLKPIVGCRFGLELEVEGSKIPRANSLAPYWMTVTDGSLRQLPEALEYKTVPLSLEGIKKALGVFEKASSNSVFKPSIRTSTHLHINVQDMTITQVANFIAIYLLLEGSLYEICGKHRKGNVFCIPLTQCDDILRRFGQLCKNQNYSSLRNLGGEGDKYAALSLRSMLLYGTLEVRTHEGVSEKELDRVYNWTTVFQGIREYATGEGVDPVAILQTASNMGPIDFTKMFLGEEFNLVDTKSFWDGISSIQYFANQSNWTPEKPLGIKETPDVEEKKPSKKKSATQGNVLQEEEPHFNTIQPRQDFLDSASTINMSSTVRYSDTCTIIRRPRMQYNDLQNDLVLDSFEFNHAYNLVRLKRRAASFYGLNSATRDQVKVFLDNTNGNIGSHLNDRDAITYIASGGTELAYLGLELAYNPVSNIMADGNVQAVSDATVRGIMETFLPTNSELSTVTRQSEDRLNRVWRLATNTNAEVQQPVSQPPRLQTNNDFVRFISEPNEFDEFNNGEE